MHGAGACSDNLKVIQGATVSKVLLEGSVATGVEYDVDGVTSTVHASHEVILSAGAFASPKILMVRQSRLRYAHTGVNARILLFDLLYPT